MRSGSLSVGMLGCCWRWTSFMIGIRVRGVKNCWNLIKVSAHDGHFHFALFQTALSDWAQSGLHLALGVFSCLEFTSNSQMILQISHFVNYIGFLYSLFNNIASAPSYLSRNRCYFTYAWWYASWRWNRLHENELIQPQLYKCYLVKPSDKTRLVNLMK